MEKSIEDTLKEVNNFMLDKRYIEFAHMLKDKSYQIEVYRVIEFLVSLCDYSYIRDYERELIDEIIAFVNESLKYCDKVKEV